MSDYSRCCMCALRFCNKSRSKKRYGSMYVQWFGLLWSPSYGIRRYWLSSEKSMHNLASYGMKRLVLDAYAGLLEV